jgi:uncharacterized membrane protein HdeD (DUF308 family)
MQMLLKKWWLVLLQGILLIILSIYIFNHPGEALVSFTLWLSILVFAAGVIGIIGWFFLDKQDRSKSELIWSSMTLLFGILLLARIGFAMEFFSAILGIWMVITGFWLIRNGWDMKNADNSGWVILIAGLLSVVTGIMVIFNLSTAAIAVSTIIGFQMLITGIGLIILAIIKRKIANEFGKVISTVKQKMN